MVQYNHPNRSLFLHLLVIVTIIEVVSAASTVLDLLFRLQVNLFASHPVYSASAAEIQIKQREIITEGKLLILSISSFRDKKQSVT